MATLAKSITQIRGSVGRGWNWRLFLEDNITGSWYQTVWIIFLALVTGLIAAGQYSSRPASTTIVLVLWVAGIASVVLGALFQRHNAVSRWLKNNLLNSVSNTILTLLIVLALVAVVAGLWQWGVVNATFDPERTAPEFRSEGATWGVLWGARKLLLTGSIRPIYHGRVWLSLFFILGLWALTFISRRPALKERLNPLRMATNVLWLFSPVILYIFLAGVSESSLNIGTMLGGVVVLLAIYLLFW